VAVQRKRAAGIRWPRMTFSLKRAAVHTAHGGRVGQHARRVWNESAEMKLSVSSESLVMPTERLSLAGRAFRHIST
jgi:hypothetical protein